MEIVIIPLNLMGCETQGMGTPEISKMPKELQLIKIIEIIKKAMVTPNPVQCETQAMGIEIAIVTPKRMHCEARARVALNQTDCETRVT